MKKLNLYLIVLFSFFAVTKIEAQDYLSKITSQSCDCLSEIEETTDREQFNLELGLCIIDAAVPYKKELKRDHQIDLDNINEDGTRLGEMIGMRMAGVCPQEIMKIANNTQDETYEDLGAYTSGTITKIENEQFVVFSLKDESGKNIKLYWLYYIDSELDLETNYTSLLGKKVEVFYYETEMFDVRINEYKTFFVIEEINLVD